MDIGFILFDGQETTVEHFKESKEAVEIGIGVQIEIDMILHFVNERLLW